MAIKITVVNKHHKHSGEYIGRGSPLGNPYSHMDGTTAQFKTATRAEAVAKYGIWLHTQIESNNRVVCNELNRLVDLAQQGELRLQCFCAPLKCHGDVIKQVLLEAMK
jgi:hypothetical protein